MKKKMLGVLLSMAMVMSILADVEVIKLKVKK